MSLTGAFNVGRSALAASQLGIQIASNNMANAGTIGYSRQVGRLQSMRGDGSIPGIMVGGGVIMRSVLRQVDDGLEARLRGSVSDQSFADVRARITAQVEDALGELGTNSLSTELSAFFRSWSERANQTRTGASVVQQGGQLAAFIRRLRGDLSAQASQGDAQVRAGVDRANQLIRSIADLNGEIGRAEVGGAVANTLRDHRDQAVRELSELMDVSVVERGQQGVDILAGSTPVVLGSQPRPLRIVRDGNGAMQVAAGDNPARLDIRGGSLGALLTGRDELVNATIARLDALASSIIFEVNRLHSSGARSDGLTTATGTLRIPSAERSLALNDPANTTLAGLPFAPTTGGFLVHVRQAGTDSVQTVRINIDLDGRTNAGATGASDDTSAEDIRAALAAIPGLSASFTADGRLDLRSAEGFSFSFSDDTSGALAVLGVNTYFTGTDAASIAVRDDLARDPTLLMAGRIVDRAFVDNATALELAGLQSRPLESLGRLSLLDAWRDGVQRVGAEAAGARVGAEATLLVRQSLEAQRAAVSGVSIDEETLNLLDFQRQYQAAARVISVAEQLTQTLLQLV